MSEKYNHRKVEAKWQKVWEKEEIYKAEDFAKTRKKSYILVEYPYPSGEGLHIGHAFTNTIGDIMARYMRMNGKNVLFPMGWDSFGLPTENSAIRLGIHPASLTKRNTARFKEQNKGLGMGFDWTREIDTSDPNYYKWTQWIFLRLFKEGLAYKADTIVGWCPSCKIILANEEVVGGRCERCGTKVTYRQQKQWLLKITKYADRLADELDLVDYPPYVKKSQREWIGRKVWTDINYPVEGVKESIVVATTRPDTNFGAAFVVLAPEHPLVAELLNSKIKIQKSKLNEISKYVERVKSKSELERISEGGVKTGVFTGLYAVNPLNNYKMPIYVTDFVLMSVGTGAVVGVPGHDRRDFEFAKKFKLPVKRVIVGMDKDTSEIVSEEQIVEGEGEVVNSGFLNGLSSKKATEKIINYLEEKGWGRKVVRYHLRDWIFSRQHYWGEPIPVIYCQNCGLVPVPENELPLKLPAVKKYQPTETGESPLANIKDWVNVSCPKCGGQASRETDTMPNWAGSSWYYLRYSDPKNNKVFAERKKLEYWQPVDFYIGGAEHTTLHLLYSRFWHKFLNDLKLVPGKEPYAARRQHGVILGEDGFRMSKSRGNVINPQEMIEKFGADTLRLYLMFMGPYDSTMNWNTTGIEGMSRFTRRLWGLMTDEKQKKLAKKDEEQVSIKMHQTIKKVTEDIQNFRYNTAISQLMTLINLVENKGINNMVKENLCLLLAPFAPHMMEEIWQTKFAKENGKFSSVHLQPWPKFDPKKVKEKKVTVVVQVNGKLRSQIIVASNQSESKEYIEKTAREDERIQKWLQKGKITKKVFIPGKLINFVIN